jgi:phenylalanyl-tRNA synthetase beta chain
MECGHPLHAFDYDRLTDHTIIVRPAFQGEKFLTLDHKARVLQSTTLMICDKEQPIAIAGVMGGENSEISDGTKSVLIESAYFNPKSIRKASKYYGLSTDASQRFERGADPNITTWAVNRAAELISKFAGGEILKNTIDIYPEKIAPKFVSISLTYANKFLDINLHENDIIKILNSYHFKYIQSIKKENDILMEFEIPTFRPDIEQEIDLVEEIARGYGYNNIRIKNETQVTFSDEKVQSDFIETLRKHAIGSGLTEIITNSMQSIDIASKYSDNYVRIINPISQEMAALRTTLVPSMLEVIRHNIHHGTPDMQLFEIGKVYTHEIGKENVLVPNYNETERIIIALTGSGMPRFWNESPRFVDIFDLKGEVVGLCNKIFLDNIKFIPYPTTDALTEIGIRIEINKVRAGYLGKIRKDILTENDIEQDVFCAELEIPVLREARSKEKQYTELPKFPPVMRDIAMFIDMDVPSERIEEEIWRCGGNLLKSVELFDVFHGKQIGPRKKSYAYALVFMSDTHTLVQDEVDRIMYKITDGLQKSLNATIRKKEDLK